MKNQRNSLRSFCMWLLPLSFFAYQFILRLWPSLMMQHIMEQLVIDCTAFGLLSSAYYWGYAGMQIPLAFALNKYETRYILSICALLCGIGMLLFSFTSHWHVALLSRFIIGAGSAVGFLGTSKVISEWFSRDNYSKMVGFTFSLGLLGAVYGGKPINIMINVYGWETIAFILSIVPLILAALTWLFLRTQSHVPNHNELATNNLQKNSLIILLKSPVFLVVAFANLLMVGSLEGFADVWGINYLIVIYNFDKSIAAQLTSFIFVGMLFGGPILAYFGKKLGNYTIISLCGIGMALLFIPLLHVPFLSWAVLAILFFLLGILCCYQVLIFTVGAELVKQNSLDMAVALLNCINMLGGSFFHTLIGYAMDKFWTGTMIGQVRYYNEFSYHYSLMIIPICAIIGAIFIAAIGWYLRKYNKQLSGLVIVITLINMFSFSAEKNNKIELINGAIGGLVGATEVVVNQPLIYAKNCAQQGKAISLNPCVFYRGLAIGVACMAPTTAIQMASENALKKIFFSTESRATTLRALLAGAFSALASTPTELIVLHQQNNGLGALETAHNLITQESTSILYRGLLAKSLRDAIFCAGFLSMNPSVEKYLLLKSNNKSIASVGSSIVTGGIIAVFSHPFDTISTVMQADISAKKTFLQTTKVIYKSAGWRGYFNGLTARGTRVALALLVMSNAKAYYTNKLFSVESRPKEYNV